MKYLLSFVLPFVFMCCQKGLTDDTTNTGGTINCDLLKQGLTNADVTTIEESLGEMLHREYSNENLEQLAAGISANCDVNAALDCFDCVKTDPPQSEMSVSFTVDGDSVHFTLNVSRALRDEIKIVAVSN